MTRLLDAVIQSQHQSLSNIDADDNRNVIAQQYNVCINADVYQYVFTMICNEGCLKGRYVFVLGDRTCRFIQAYHTILQIVLDNNRFHKQMQHMMATWQ